MSVATAPVSALPMVVTLGPTSGRRASRDSGGAAPGGQAAHFASVEALLDAAEPAWAVLLTHSDARVQQQWLAQLRRHPRYCLAPLFVTQAGDTPDQSLADGIAETPATCVDAASHIRDKLATLSHEPTADPESRLLSFLYSRPARSLLPVRDWRSEHLYRYPLLDAFRDEGVTAVEWLRSLAQRKLVEPTELIDRIRSCPDCDGAHLNYVDLCTSCAGLDISEKIFLHCYTCGHVAEQQKYLGGHGLACPKCQAQLRHIGVDYDRALETYSCAACDSRFGEPDVRARCLHCGTTHATEQLPEHRIQRWRLSASGALVARTGAVSELFSLLDDFNYAHPAYFERTLEWQIDLHRRHREITFGVVCIRFENIRELLESATRFRTAQLVDEFAGRLRELVRTTDLVTRTDDSHCWLLLPQTPSAGVTILRQRIEALPAQGTTDAAHRLRVAVSTRSSDELGDAQIPATLLMSEMLGALP